MVLGILFVFYWLSSTYSTSSLKRLSTDTFLNVLDFLPVDESRQIRRTSQIFNNGHSLIHNENTTQLVSEIQEMSSLKLTIFDVLQNEKNYTKIMNFEFRLRYLIHNQSQFRNSNPFYVHLIFEIALLLWVQSNKERSVRNINTDVILITPNALMRIDRPRLEKSVIVEPDSEQETTNLYFYSVCVVLPLHICEYKISLDININANNDWDWRFTINISVFNED
jgi:hypothetical protein